MFHQRTLFVVGAGASEEVGLPLGAGLANNIAAKMDISFEHGYVFVGTGDQSLYEQLLNARRQDGDQWFFAAKRLRDGLPFAQSIDDFLDQRRTDKFVNLYGKSAICKAILEAEKASKLFFNPFEGHNPFEVGPIQDTWFVKFMYMLCKGIPRENVSQIFKNIGFIVFNYDRCIEQFLISSLERAYSIKREDAVALVNGLDILHPYGSVGSLRDIQFGATALNCVSLAERIKTYTEQADDQTILKKIQDRVEASERIVFLGFAYHSQNMLMLQAATGEATKIVYGTAYGMSGPDVTEVHKLISRTIRPREIHIENKLKCAGLFEHYAKSLSGGD